MFPLLSAVLATLPVAKRKTIRGFDPPKSEQGAAPSTHNKAPSDLDEHRSILYKLVLKIRKSRSRRPATGVRSRIVGRLDARWVAKRATKCGVV